MSVFSDIPVESIDSPTTPDPEAVVLRNVVGRTLAYEQLPDWYEYTTARWAIKDTVERVAPIDGAGQ